MRSVLARVRLVATDDRKAATDLLTHEMPSVRVELTNACGVCDAIVDAPHWTAASDLSELDAAVASSPSDALSVRGSSEDLAEIACQVLGRYQRFIDRRNLFSKTPAFDAILRGHCGAYGMDEVGWDRSLDRWQWLLRIAPHAQVAAQVAALFRDMPHRIERIVHAAGLADAIAVRAMRMARDGDPDVEDAEALSFLSLESHVASRHEVTRVASSLSEHAITKLPLVRVSPEVRHWIYESLAA